MEKSIENVIEWLDGDETATVTLSKSFLASKIKRAAEKNPAIKIMAVNKDGSICVHLPVEYIKIDIPRAQRKINI